MTSRRAIALTAGREIGERVRSRAFVVSFVVQLAIVLVVVVILAISGGDEGERFEVGAVGGEATELVREVASSPPPDVEIELEELGDEPAAARGVADGDLEAAVAGSRLIIAADANSDLSALLQSAAARAEVRGALDRAGVPSGEVAAALDPEPLAVQEVGEDEESAAGVALFGTLLLYLGIFGFGYLVTSSIVEEKSSRVVEIVLSAVRPIQLLAGKVLGIGLLGIGQLLATVVVGIGAALATGQIDLPDSTAEVTALVVLYFLLGYALYACAFAVAGAIVSRQEDVGSVMTPITITLLAGYLLSFSATDDPGGALATIGTFVPPLAPLIVPARAAEGELPAGELAISVVLMVAAIAAFVWLAGRVYERAVLRTGAPMKLIEGLKLARR